MGKEADLVRARLFDDPFVDNATYGELLEEAMNADERASWRAEMDPDMMSDDDREFLQECADEERYFSMLPGGERHGEVRGWYDLPIFGWAWSGDAGDLER